MNWNLTSFYKNDEAWKKDLDFIDNSIKDIEKYKGKLNDIKMFKEYHQQSDKLTKVIYKVYQYASLGSDLNLKDQNNANKKQLVMMVLSKLSQASSFVSPEIISIGKDKIFAMLEKDSYLKEMTFNFEALFNEQKHVLSDLEEKILANFGPVRNTPQALYQSLSIIDRTNEIVTLKDGSKVEVNASNYPNLIRDAKHKKDRQTIFEGLYKRYKDNKSAFANVYNLVQQLRVSNYKSRNYKSSLNMALDGNNISESVYLNLKDTVYENNKIIQRYINLRKKHLNLDTYCTYDRFLELAKDDTKYPYEEAKNIFFNSIKDYSKEFVTNQHEALKDGFVDVLPKDGKRTGAYSSCTYGNHPFILLNHNDSLDSMFTLAHEAGHSAHSIFADANQPMCTSDYTIFVAEIASTFNEHALLDYLLKTSKTKEQKIVLIEKAINNIMGTFVRQTLFATYEYEVNKLLENGTPINDQVLSKIMIDLYKHYYNIDITKENGKELVWAYIPHLFYTPFYVYQYATSFAASSKIYADIKANKPKAMDNFIGLLKSGGNDYPVNQVKKAGCDLESKEPFKAVFNRFEELIDLLEETLK